MVHGILLSGDGYDKNIVAQDEEVGKGETQKSLEKLCEGRCLLHGERGALLLEVQRRSPTEAGRGVLKNGS
jgi:hypothetical protein